MTVCRRNKGLQRQPAGKLMPLPIPTEAWEVVRMDRITHLPKTEQGHTAISVVVDKLTKMSSCAVQRHQQCRGYSSVVQGQLL